MSLQWKLRKYQQKDDEKLEKMNDKSVKRQSVSRRKWQTKSKAAELK